MEKRGSGLKKMQNLESTLPTYKGIPTPTFESDAHAFFTKFRNMNYGLEETDFLKLLGDHGEGELGEGIPKTTPFGKTTSKRLGKTAQLIIDMMISDPTTTREQFAEAAHVSIDAIKWQIKKHIKD